MSGLSFEPFFSSLEINAGMDPAGLLDPNQLADGDVVVFPQKVVSKSEGRCVDLGTIVPSPRAEDLASTVRKPAAFVEVVLRESKRVVRAAPNVLIVETTHGFICANAGVDRSNVPAGWVCLLPADPDASAAALRERLEKTAGRRLGVVISDTFGRPWRLGQVDVAIGASGIVTLLNMRGQPDRLGRPLEVTELGIGDAIAAGAGLVMRKAAGVIAVRVRGLSDHLGAGAGRDLLRPQAEDLFR